MADVSDFLREMEEQLDPPDVQEIKYLLKDTLFSKLHNYIILILKGKKQSYVFLILFFQRYASLE